MDAVQPARSVKQGCNLGLLCGSGQRVPLDPLWSFYHEAQTGGEGLIDGIVVTLLPEFIMGLEAIHEVSA